MMKKITLITLAFFLGLFGVMAQSTSCVDMNGYVDSKNTGGTGFYTLLDGVEEMAAQTYHYSGPGRVSQVRVYGNYPLSGGVPLRISVYNVDVNGRPTSQISFVDDVFFSSDNALGFITVSLPSGGTSVSNDFAIVVSIRTGFPFGNTFQLEYTGNGEGLGEDLASLAGSSTGGNWASAMTAFNKDGDFYLVPIMTNFITSAFTPSTLCATTTTSISFANTTTMSVDSMFNQIALTGYTGSNEYYSWDFGDGSPVSNVMNPTHTYSAAGSYTVSLTSTLEGWSNTCTNVKTMVISVGLNVTASAITNVTCNGSIDGSVTAAPSGGTAPYTYSLNGVTYQSSTTFSGLSAGSYTLHIKDALGCLNANSFTITQPAAIVFTSAAATNSSCGNSDGAILVSTSGGTGTVQYQLNAGTFQSSGSFTGLSSGSYMITAKDANNCTNVIFVIVNDLGSPTLTVTSTTNVSCYGGNDGTIVLSATGGTGTLQYSIDGGLTFQASGSFTGLIAGKYSVLVKDASGCTQGMVLAISQPQEISFTTSSTSTSCNGGNDGQINITSAIGGIGTLTYSINGISYQSSTNFSGLSAGTYTVYVKGSASCVTQATVVVSQPTQMMATFTTVNAGCYGSSDGSIIVNATGGTPLYMYTINGGSAQPINDFMNLVAGTYTINVMDFHNCTYSANVTITQPFLVVASTTSTNSTCGNSNGGLLAVASGGSGSGYEYSLDGTIFNTTGSFTGLAAGNYFITVKDGTGCTNVVSETVFDSNGPSITSSSSTNISCSGGNDGTITVNTVTGGTGALVYSLNGLFYQSSSVFANLSAGSYTVYVKDANGCIGTTSITLTQPSAFTISSSLVHVSCHNGNNGSVTILAAGGAGTLAYSINGGASYQSSNVFSGLTANTYNVIVRDIAGCTGTISFTITQPNPIISYVGILNVTCYGSSDGALTIYAFGGTGALQYSMNGSTYQSSNIFTGLSGGVKTVYLKDANNCVKTHSVIIAEPLALALNPSVSNVSCAGGNNGAVNLNVSGGSGNNTYLWSTGATTEDVSGLVNGSYSVFVQDGNGCTLSGSYVITEPLAPIVVNSVINGTTTNTGSIDATVTGGTMPYSYSWSNGANTEDISNITPGIYTLTVTDVYGCISTNQFIVPAVAGLDENTTINALLNVYPNPTRESATIEMVGYTIEKIEVLNLLGQLILEGEPNSSKTQINTIQFENGVYIIQVHVDNQVIIKKLQVIK